MVCAEAIPYDLRNSPVPKNQFALLSSLLALCVALLTSCRYEEVAGQCPFENTIGKGAKFRITLPESHAGSEMWQLSSNDNPAAVSQLNSAWHGEEKGIDFNFVANAPGKANLQFFKRKFTDTVETRCYRVTITAN
jgi:hypothetical protein